jgi:hypothetical protein
MRIKELYNTQFTTPHKSPSKTTFGGFGKRNKSVNPRLNPIYTQKPTLLGSTTNF